MTIIYDTTETNFIGNGIAVLSPVSCEVVEAINGDYQLEMVHMIDEHNKYKEIIEDRIIQAETHRGRQPFRVYRVDRDIAGELHVYARHISYDLLQGLILNAAPTDTTAKEALRKALENTGFTGGSDVPGMNSVRWVRKSNLAAIMGTEDNSIINRWGGEVERSGFAFNIRRQLGSDNGVSVRYGKNLTGLDATTDLSGVKTRIYPTGLQEDGQTVLSLPEEYIDSPNIGMYANVRTIHIHYGDIKIGEEYPTPKDAYAALRKAANAEFEAGLDKPTVSMDVSFVDLSRTREYQDYAVLEKVDIGDQVHIYHELLQVEAKARAVSVRWNCLLKRYVSISLGQVQTSLAAANQAVSRQIAHEISGVQTAVRIATDALNAPGNSYVRFMPNISNPAEVYIMDAPEPENANHVLRMNSAGWGLSKTGINGPFTIAATGAGMVASAITTGILNANLIQVSGAGTYLDGKSLVIQHPAISAKTVMDTGGMRMYVILPNGTEQLIGGLYTVGGRTVNATNYIMDPNYPRFAARIGAMPAGEEGYGIELLLDGVQYARIALAHPEGAGAWPLRIDAEGEVVFRLKKPDQYISVRDLANRLDYLYSILD